jgi:hypothetical protein
MSMFREHWIGGLVAYTSFFVISLGIALTGIFVFRQPIDWNPTVSLEPLKIAACFVIAVLSGLWPDVDTKSKSQQIFYRIFIIFNVVLIYMGHYSISAFFGLFAMLPLIGNHRGWTHSKLTMLLLPAVFLILSMVYFQRDQFDQNELLAAQNLVLLKGGLPFYTAGLIGYATHLHLDGILLQSRKAQRRQARAS